MKDGRLPSGVWWCQYTLAWSAGQLSFSRCDAPDRPNSLWRNGVAIVETAQNQQLSFRSMFCLGRNFCKIDVQLSRIDRMDIQKGFVAMNAASVNSCTSGGDN